MSCVRRSWARPATIYTTAHASFYSDQVWFGDGGVWFVINHKEVWRSAHAVIEVTFDRNRR